jgi:hypothetical protein
MVLSQKYCCLTARIISRAVPGHYYKRIMALPTNQDVARVKPTTLESPPYAVRCARVVS